MSPLPVLVAGAGPTGLVLACGLAAAGVPVRVVDAAPGPATTSRALGLQPRGVEVLDRTGALGDLPARGLPVRTVAVHVGGRPLARLAVGGRTRLGTRPGLLVSQADVEATLRARFTELGGTVRWDCAVTGLEQHADGVLVRLGDGTTTRAGWVAGCDGAHSRVRALTGTRFPGVPVAERFLLADVVAALPLPRDTVAVWLDGEEMIAAFPLPGHDVWRLMAPAPDAPDGLPGAAVAARLAADLHRHAGVPADAVRATLWTSEFRIHRRLADRYRTGRVLLAGDAAHIHSPIGGQGLNTGLGDAENLAWKLALVAGGRADPALLDTYEAERRPVAEEVLASTTGLTRVVLGGSAAARLLRDHVLVPLMDRPRVQRMIAERSSQLRVGYRRGPLGGRDGVGDRVPDLAVRGGRLHAALGPGWAVVASDRALRGACAAAAAGLGGVAELEPELPSRDALLVRPDGHLAWRGTDPAALAARLTDRLHLHGVPVVAG